MTREERMANPEYAAVIAEMQTLFTPELMLVALGIIEAALARKETK